MNYQLLISILRTPKVAPLSVTYKERPYGLKLKGIEAHGARNWEHRIKCMEHGEVFKFQNQVFQTFVR
jgi:hypothetical protein